MMKSKKLLMILTLIFALSLFCFAGCSGCGKSVYFEQDEYTVRSGDKIKANGKATYILIGETPNGVSVSKDGVFTVLDDVENGVQVLLGAVKKNKVVDTAVCKIIVDMVVPEISVLNLSNYIVDGETVQAVSVPEYSVSYGLNHEYLGITINEVTGKVSFTDKVTDGVPFVVTMSAKGVTISKTFYTAVSDMISVTTDTLFCEVGGNEDLTLTLDFPQTDLIEEGVLGVSYGKERATSGDFSFDGETCTVTLKSSLLSRLDIGENIVKLATAKNTVSVTVKKAVYIATAEDLAKIGQDKETLSGYYVQVSNIDLTAYLSNSNEGWFPIGTYKDVTDGTATEMAFNGTYDGNGKTISGFYISRNDAIAYNSGLFGYAGNNAIITNLTLKCSTEYSHNVRSYSGVLVGVNCGVISNCAVYGEINAEGCKTVGVFVGRNEGNILNSYSVGNVIAEESYGAFCGTNMSKITDCYAVSQKITSFCGVGDKGQMVYLTESDMLQSADFSSWTGWNKSSESLTIKSHDVKYSLRALSVVNQRTEYIKGMKFDLAVTGNPADLTGYELSYQVMKGEVEYVSVVNGKVDLTNAKVGEYTIRVYGGDVYTDFTFSVKESVEDIIAIYTVQDFISFKSNKTNYDKTVILMANLDFENAEMTSIGFYREEDEDLSGVFSGVFDGNGYAISNLKIIRNSYDGDYGEGNYDTNKWHTSYYNVGLFCFVTGTVKNLTLDGVTVSPTFNGEECGNYVGVVCGTLFGNIINCQINNCIYYGSDDATLKAGIVCGSNHGSIVGVTVDEQNYGDM